MLFTLGVYLVVDSHNFEARGVAAHDFDAAFGYVEVLCEKLDHCRIRLAVYGALLHKHCERVVICGRMLFNERPFAASRFDAHRDLHHSRLTRTK